MAPFRFKSLLEASSCQAPGGGEAYKPLREAIVKQALEQGFDGPTMVEHAVSWADDQDPWNHIMNAKYPQFASMAGFRVFESFEEQLKDKHADLMKARGLGVIVKQSALEIKRSVSYPDSIIVANRINEVRPDRYHLTVKQWSLQQQAPVAESNGWVVFFDYSKGRPANLLEAGGNYADLYHALGAKSKASKEKQAAWDLAHPKKSKGAKL